MPALKLILAKEFNSGAVARPILLILTGSVQALEIVVLYPPNRQLRTIHAVTFLPYCDTSLR